MKRIYMFLYFLIVIAFSMHSQSIIASCQTRNNQTFEDYYTECYINFSIPQKTIKVTFPKSITLSIKGIESLSSGKLTLLAKGNEGDDYKLYFNDLSDFVGSPTMTLRVDKQPYKKSAFTYTYFLDPNIIIPILNKYLENM